jgi:hypothetical protein
MKFLTSLTTPARVVLMLAVLVGLAGCGSSAHRTPAASSPTAAAASTASSPTAAAASTANSPIPASSEAPSLSPAELKDQASAAASVCAAWHDYYRYMTAQPAAINLAVQSMLTMSGNSLAVSAGNPQFPTLQDDVYQLMAASAANPLRPLNSDMPGVAGLQRQCP